MILESVFSFALTVFGSFLDTLNFTFADLPSWGVNVLNLVLKGLAFFPFEIWSVVVSNIFFWIGVHFVWAIIEWIYVKIPGVN